MLFWIICVVMALVAAAFVLQPVLRARIGADTVTDVDVYKAQLTEIDRDVARGVLPEDEAERTRVEVARRLLLAEKSTSGPGVTGPGRWVVILALPAILLVSLGVYTQIGTPGEPDQPLSLRLQIAEEMRANRPSQAKLVAAAPSLPPVEASEELLEAVAQLRAVVAERPDDLTGLGFLARYEAELRNYDAAAQAQGRIVALKEDGATIEDRRLLLDLMVTAANGFVSPEAEEILRGILGEDDQNVAARYHLGALYDQTARPDVAFRLWRPLVETGLDTYHTALARAQVEGAAARAGVEYTIPEVRGPGLDDIAAAQDMAPEDRAAMIGNMVNGLAERLATQGGPASDWARLIRAYGVLGETEIAADVWTEAQQLFGADPGGMALLLEAAQSAGVAE